MRKLARILEGWDVYRKGHVILPQLRILRASGAFRPAHKVMQGEGDFVGMRCAPGNNALELDGIVGDGADFRQLGFNDLRVSHRKSSIAHVKK